MINQNNVKNNHVSDSIPNSHIVIVDDDKDLIQLYSEYLTLNGFKTIIFDDPLKVIDHLYNDNISCSLVISDFKMPKMNGIELIRNIRKIEKYKDRLKFIILTAYLKDQFLVSNMTKPDHSRVDKILEKPVRLQELKTAVLEVLSI